MVIGADFSAGEEVTGKSGDQVSNTEGGCRKCKMSVLNKITPDVDPFVLFLYTVASDKLCLRMREAF